MKKYDPEKVLGEQPLWYIWYYLALINITYFWRKIRGKIKNEA